MDKKLTIKLDEKVINKAKQYAQANKRSLSRVIESYLRNLTEVENTQPSFGVEIDPFVQSLSSGTRVPLDLDLRKEVLERVESKSSKR